jgi:hypothetical protein
MTVQGKSGIWQDSFGNAIASATVTVYEVGTETLATIYTDTTGGTEATNPIVPGTDADGRWEVYANGTYDIKFTKSGYDSFTMEDVQFFDRPATLALISTNAANINTLGAMRFDFVQSDTPSATAANQTWLDIDDGKVYTSTGTGTGNWVETFQYLLNPTSDVADFTGGIKVNTIAESTADTGVTIDSVLLKDNTVTATSLTGTSSLGTLTALDIDNININGNTISSVGDLNLTPDAGNQVVIDGTIQFDAGVITGATSITSTAFVGDITGNLTGNASGTAATVTGAAQTAITSLGTLTALDVDNININGNTISSVGDLNLTPDAGNQIVLDGTIQIDAGVMTGATSITSTLFTGDLIGDVTGNLNGTVGTLTELTVDNVNINGNTVSSVTGDLNLTPSVGNQIVLDGIINVDAGVVTGATSITSTAFVGDVTGNLTGNVTGNVSGTALTVTQAAQPAITSLGTLTILDVDNININGNTISSVGDLNLTPDAGNQIVLDGVINVDAGVITGVTSLTVDNILIDGNTISTTGDLNLTPDAGNQVVIDGTIQFDAGVVTGATSITSTDFAGNLTGTILTNSQPNITTIGTLSELTVDNIVINGNTISTTGDLNLSPNAGNQVVIDSTIEFDGGVVTGATSITSTAFAGNLTGNVTGDVSGSAATVTGATQAAITTCSNLVTVGALDSGSITSNFGSIDNGSSNITTLGTISGGTFTDGTLSSTAGTITGGVSITSTAFVGDLTGNASGTAATVTGATQAAITTCANLVSVGALDSGSITSNFGNIDVGSSSIAGGSFDASGGNITNVGTITATTLAGTLSTAAQTNITSVGALDGGSITSNFGAINNGASNITTTGTISGGTITDGTFSSTAGAITGVASMVVADGATIGQASGPLLTFDDTNNFLEITGCKVGFGTDSPGSLVDLLSSVAGAPTEQRIRHSDNTDTGSHSLLYLLTAGASGGDPFIKYEVAGVGQWVTGLDNSDSDKFKIGWGATLGAGTTAMTLATNGGVLMPALKSGATQVAAGAAADELWYTVSHATLPDYVVMIGV